MCLRVMSNMTGAIVLLVGSGWSRSRQIGMEGEIGLPQVSRRRQEEAPFGGFVTCGTSCSARWLGQQVKHFR